MFRRIGRSTCWALLLGFGQLASLQMVQAGPAVSYQHYYRFDELFSRTPAWALAITLIELLAVVGSYGELRRALATLAPRTRWTLVAVGLIAFLVSATASREPQVFLAELMIASVVQAVHLAVALLFARSISFEMASTAGRRLRELLRWDSADAPDGFVDRVAMGAATWVTVLSAGLAYFVYERHPHIPDEVVYLLQAKYLASGVLSLPAPPVPGAFDVDLMMTWGGRWFSAMPSGWAFLLAIGVKTGAPWMVNPLLGGVNILLTFVLVRRLYSLRLARLCAVLLAASPWNLFLAMSFMSHTASLTATLLAAIAVEQLRRDPRVRWSVAGGVGIGLVALNRPLEGLAVAFLLGLWALPARGGRLRYAPFLVLTAATALTSALALPYNRALTGSARVFPVMLYMNSTYGVGKNDLGFGPDRGLGWQGLDPFPGHGVVDVAINADFNLFQINSELLGWACGSLLLVLLFCLRSRLTKIDWQMLFAITMIAGVHSVYYFSGGPDFGARYWYLTIVPLLILSARGIETLHAYAETRSPDGGARVLLACSLLLVVAMVVFVPWRAADKYFHFRGMRPDVRALAAREDLRDGVVLIAGRRHPDYASAVVYNRLSFEGDAPVFVWDRDSTTRIAIARHFPTRRFWLVDGPTVTGDGYRLIAGPMTPEELLRESPSPRP